MRYENSSSNDKYKTEMFHKLLDLFNTAIKNKEQFVIDCSFNKNIGKTACLKELSKMYGLTYLDHRDKCLSFAYKYTPIVLVDEIRIEDYEKLVDAGLKCVGFIKI